MKIIFLCNEYPPRPHGGIGTAVQILARGLANRGHEIRVVGLGSRAGVERDGSIEVITLRRNTWPRVGNLISRIRLQIWLQRQITRAKVDLIEAPDWEGLLPFGVRHCAVVVRLHLSLNLIKRSLNETGAKGVRLFEALTLRNNRDWIGVSKHVLDATRSAFGIDPRRAAVIYNALDFQEAPSYVVEGAPLKYVVFAGQVSRRKGAYFLAEAMRDVLANKPELHLVYAGGFRKEDGLEVREKIENLLGGDLMRRVHFLGHLCREDALSWIKNAEVFAFPSRLEACPMVIIEAMVLGIPVVFSATGPGPEMVEDGVTGLLADSNDAMAFGEKIRQVLDDRELAGRLSRNAQAAAKLRFSVDRCIDETERFYQECVDGKKRGPAVSKMRT